MKVVFIAQEDHFVIPQNVERILDLDGVEGAAIVILDTRGAVVNRKAIFLRGFGLLQGARMGLNLAGAVVLDRIDRLFGARWLNRKRSIRSVAVRRSIPCHIVKSPNAEPFLERLRAVEPDLIISFSAPCVFEPPLLAIPRLGCINLHCSLLPHYAGLLPSFWVLFHGEKSAGATVHYMDDKIDNGAILGQAAIDVTPGTTMMELIRHTKAEGGRLMAQVVQDLAAGNPNSISNPSEKGSYFSWPTIEQMREFRREGGRLI